jgi:hypothetical protein
MHEYGPKCGGTVPHLSRTRTTFGALTLLLDEPAAAPTTLTAKYFHATLELWMPLWRDETVPSSATPKLAPGSDREDSSKVTPPALDGRPVRDPTRRS